MLPLGPAFWWRVGMMICMSPLFDFCAIMAIGLPASSPQTNDSPRPPEDEMAVSPQLKAAA